MCGVWGRREVKELKSSERQDFNAGIAKDAEFAEEETRTQDPPSKNEDGAPSSFWFVGGRAVADRLRRRSLQREPKSPRAKPAREAPEEKNKGKSGSRTRCGHDVSCPYGEPDENSDPKRTASPREEGSLTREERGFGMTVFFEVGEGEENPRPALRKRGWGTRREKQTQEKRDPSLRSGRRGGDWGRGMTQERAVGGVLQLRIKLIGIFGHGGISTHRKYTI